MSEKNTEISPYEIMTHCASKLKTKLEAINQDTAADNIEKLTIAACYFFISILHELGKSNDEPMNLFCRETFIIRQLLRDYGFKQSSKEFYRMMKQATNFFATAVDEWSHMKKGGAK